MNNLNMGYNKFKKLDQLRKQFGLKDLVVSWLPKSFPAAQVGHKLLDALEDARKEPLGTEKAKSEYIITPILKELKRNNPDRFSSFSGYAFEVDGDRDLNGFCDFILSAEANRGEITAPIFCLVEAKNDNVEKGIAQCGAEMYAAKLYNQQEGTPREVIYGCVTTAFSWCFLKLENQHFYIDPDYVPLTFAEPHKVLAVLQWILTEALGIEKMAVKT